MILRYLNIVLTNFLILLIKIYQLILSPLFNSNCRYLPTCSEYTIIALKKHDLIKGIYFALKRISSCHPLGKSGYDPVPDKLTKKN